MLLVAIAIGLCVWTIKAAGTLGLSRLFGRYALATRNATVSQAATQLTPGDPQAHRAHAALLKLTDAPAEAAVELERAVAARPGDFSLWLGLGQFRDQLGDSAGALAAFNESVKCAPFYAQPRWQRGNFLLRTRQFEDAFKDLNYAAQSNPELVPNLIDLTWNLSKGDARLTEEWAQIKTGKMRVAFATFLARQGKAKEAMEQFRAAGNVPSNIRQELLNQLLAKNAFSEAFEIWKMNQGTQSNAAAVPMIQDGGFEGTLSLSEEGFGWRLPNLKTAALSVDQSQPHTDANSLRVDFGGDSPPDTPVLSQLILVEPSTRYQINFAARAQEIVTGGLPLAVVTDAADHKRLGQSSPMPGSTSDWKVFSFEFTTGPTTTGALLSIQRVGCATSPCPIFGSLSLDSFSITPLR